MSGGARGAQAELVEQMDISGSLEDLQDQNVIVYLLRVFRDKYYSRVCAPVYVWVPSSNVTSKNATISPRCSKGS